MIFIVRPPTKKEIEFHYSFVVPMREAIMATGSLLADALPSVYDGTRELRTFNN